MGEYYDVADVKKRGRFMGRNRNFATHPPVFGYRLVMVLSNGPDNEIAPDVSAPSELKQFYDNYYAGAWLDYNLYDYEPQ